MWSMRAISLRVKVSFYLFIALSAAVVAFTLLILEHRRDDMEREVARHVTQISDVIVASTRYTMLVNERDIAGKIIEDIGKQKGIERVRVISKDGTIIHSNRSSEVGYSVDQQAEPCIQCHLTSTPLKQVSDSNRWKIIEMTGGHRVLAAMHAIRNERSCSSASCHEHSPGQTVLGIVDIAYSLDEIDQAMQLHSIHLIGMSLGFLLIFSVSIGYLLKRLIYVPLRDLDAGVKKIASGSFDQDIPVRNKDEFGRVAGSFNLMTHALHQ